jgi:oligoendopeptidase F
MGLYQMYREGQPGFRDSYDQLLAESGMASAVDLGNRVGIDISDTDFWAGSYEVVRRRIERYEELVDERISAG